MQIAYLHPSPDQPWEVYNGPYELWVMDATGTNQRKIAVYEPSFYAEIGTFSPDGCFYAASDGQTGVLIDLQTGEKIIIDQAASATGQVAHFAWSPDSSSLIYYRGEIPDGPIAAHELQQVQILPDGSLGARQTYPLEESIPAMVPEWVLTDGRVVLRAGLGGNGLSYVTDLDAGTPQLIVIEGSEQAVELSDIAPDGRAAFKLPRESLTAPYDPNIYLGQLTEYGTIVDVDTISPPEQGWPLFGAKFVPDQESVLALVLRSSAGIWDFGNFTPLNDGTYQITPLLESQSAISGYMSLGLEYAVVASAERAAGPFQIWLVALNGSQHVPLAEGFFPVTNPICDR